MERGVWVRSTVSGQIIAAEGGFTTKIGKAVYEPDDDYFPDWVRPASDKLDDEQRKQVTQRFNWMPYAAGIAIRGIDTFGDLMDRLDDLTRVLAVVAQHEQERGREIDKHTKMVGALADLFTEITDMAAKRANR
jgi:hypothetical protein